MYIKSEKISIHIHVLKGMTNFYRVHGIRLWWKKLNSTLDSICGYYWVRASPPI